nr:MAG: hypothetical protein [Bacteriophage sp.]
MSYDPMLEMLIRAELSDIISTLKLHLLAHEKPDIETLRESLRVMLPRMQTTTCRKIVEDCIAAKNPITLLEMILVSHMQSKTTSPNTPVVNRKGRK